MAGRLVVDDVVEGGRHLVILRPARADELELLARDDGFEHVLRLGRLGGPPHLEPFDLAPDETCGAYA